MARNYRHKTSTATYITMPCKISVTLFSCDQDLTLVGKSISYEWFQVMDGSWDIIMSKIDIHLLVVYLLALFEVELFNS